MTMPELERSSDAATSVDSRRKTRKERRLDTLQPKRTLTSANAPELRAWAPCGRALPAPRPFAIGVRRLLAALLPLSLALLDRGRRSLSVRLLCVGVLAC